MKKSSHREAPGMKNETAINFHGRVARRSWPVLGLIVLMFLGGSIHAQHQGTMPKAPTDWKEVQAVFGFPGDILADGVIRFNMPRKDLHVR